jgi:hypothetical protein
MITAQQKTFFETFGFLRIPAACSADIAWITAEFEAAWKARTDLKQEGKASFPITMIAASPRLTSLINHAAVLDAADALLGSGWSCYGGDGNLFAGDTGWHSDCEPDQWQFKSTVRHVKIVWYLDPTMASTGALRVVPGSHHHGDRYCELVQQGLVGEGHVLNSGAQVPAHAIETSPGDLVVFDHRLKHASFGGGNRRRMFCINLFGPMHDPVEREAVVSIMRQYRDQQKINWLQGPGWVDWIATMTPEQKRHFLYSLELGAEVAQEAVGSP